MPKEIKITVPAMGENFTWDNDDEARATLFLLTKHEREERCRHSPESPQGTIRIDFHESCDGTWKSSLI